MERLGTSTGAGPAPLSAVDKPTLLTGTGPDTGARVPMGKARLRDSDVACRGVQPGSNRHRSPSGDGGGALERGIARLLHRRARRNRGEGSQGPRPQRPHDPELRVSATTHHRQPRPRGAAQARWSVRPADRGGNPRCIGAARRAPPRRLRDDRRARAHRSVAPGRRHAAQCIAGARCGPCPHSARRRRSRGGPGARGARPSRTRPRRSIRALERKRAARGARHGEKGRLSRPDGRHEGRSALRVPGRRCSRNVSPTSCPR